MYNLVDMGTHVYKTFLIKIGIMFVSMPKRQSTPKYPVLQIMYKWRNIFYMNQFCLSCLFKDKNMNLTRMNKFDIIILI